MVTVSINANWESSPNVRSITKNKSDQTGATGNLATTCKEELSQKIASLEKRTQNNTELYKIVPNFVN